MECIWVPGTRKGYSIAYEFQMKALIYEKFGAVLQVQYFVYYTATAVWSEGCCLLPKELKLQDSVVLKHTTQ